MKERFAKALIEGNKNFIKAGIKVKKKLTLKERLRRALHKMFEKEMTKHLQKEVANSIQNKLSNQNVADLPVAPSSDQANLKQQADPRL